MKKIAIFLTLIIQLESAAYAETLLFGFDLNLNFSDFKSKYQSKIKEEDSAKVWKFGIRGVETKTLYMKKLKNGQKVSAEFIKNNDESWEILSLNSSDGNFTLSEALESLSKRVGYKIKIKGAKKMCGMQEDTPCVFYDKVVRFHKGEIAISGRDMYSAKTPPEKIDMRVYGSMFYTNTKLRDWLKKQHFKPKPKKVKYKPSI